MQKSEGKRPGGNVCFPGTAKPQPYAAVVNQQQ